MRNLMLLLRVQLYALANSLSPARRSGKTGRGGRVIGGALTVVACIVLVAIVEFYLAMIGFAMAFAGLLDIIPVLAVTMGALAGVVFTFMKANGTLFGFADYDLVMSLPVSRRCVVASRLTALFVSATVLALLCMAPLYVMYFVMGGVSVPALIAAVLSIVLAPVIPTSLAVFFSFALTALSARFRHANLVYIVFALIGITGIVVASYAISFNIGSGGAQQTVSSMSAGLMQVRDAVSSTYPPAVWAAQAVNDGNMLALALFVGASLAVGGACLEILQRSYLAINGLLAGRARSVRLDASRLARGNRASSPLRALIVKEFRTQIGMPSYAINCLFGYVLMLLIAVALTVADGREQIAAALLSELGGVDVRAGKDAIDQVFLLLPWIFAFCGIASPAAAVALSLEGKQAWIVATLPVSLRTVLAAKLTANALPFGSLLLACAAMLLVGGQVSALEALEVVVCGFGLFYLVVNLGIAIDARRPNFAWTSVQEVVKRSAPILTSVLVGMFLVFALAGLTMFGTSIWGTSGSHALILASGVAGAVGGQLLFSWTCRRVPKLEL